MPNWLGEDVRSRSSCLASLGSVCSDSPRVRSCMLSEDSFKCNPIITANGRNHAPLEIYPANLEISTLSTGAVFLPSTVPHVGRVFAYATQPCFLILELFDLLPWSMNPTEKQPKHSGAISCIFAGELVRCGRCAIMIGFCPWKLGSLTSFQV